MHEKLLRFVRVILIPRFVDGMSPNVYGPMEDYQNCTTVVFQMFYFNARKSTKMLVRPSIAQLKPCGILKTTAMTTLYI